MITKIDNSTKQGSSHIQILFPGIALNLKDTGFSTIGRIDQAHLQPGSFVPMHPHINDDILSYFRTGKVKHTDSEGFTEFIEPTRLMLMKAGKKFYHEEKILDDSEVLEGLQIFIRPATKDIKPEVIFHELESVHSENTWRLIASPTKETPLQFSSQTWIYDMKITDSKSYSLPAFKKENLTCLLYNFQGSSLINETINLAKGESILIKDEAISIKTNDFSELVLFVTDENSHYFAGGMYSGNQMLL